MHSRSLLLTVLSALPFVAPVAAGAAQDDAAPAIVIDGVGIPWRTFAAWLVELRGEARVDSFVTVHMIERTAREVGVTVSDEDVLRHVREQVDVRVERAFRGDRSRWLAELEHLGSTEREYELRQALETRPGLLADGILAAERVVTEEDVRTLFERRYGRDGRRLVVRALRLRLVVPTPEGEVSTGQRQQLTRETKARLVARLRVLRDRAAAGESFTDLIAKYSEDEASRRQDGVLEQQVDRGGWPAEALDVVYALAPEEISAPVYGRGHYNLFQLVREERVALENVADALREELHARPADAGEMQDLRARLRDGCVVEVRPAMTSGGDAPDDVVLAISGQEISRGTYAAWLGVSRGSTLARSFVEGWLIEREARAAGITVTAQEVQARVDMEIQGLIDRFFDGDKQKWLLDIARKGSTEERNRRERTVRARVDLTVEQLMAAARVIGPEEVRAHWEATYGPGGRLLDVRMIRQAIVLPTDIAGIPREELNAIAEAAIGKTMGELAELRSRALAGEDFGVLAERHSDDPTRANGGRAPERFPFTNFPDTVRSALFALKPGELTEPVQIGPACWLFELAGEEIIPLERVANAVRAELEAELPGATERAGYMNTALQRSDWRVFLENFR
ncbi:MAG: hypothetical protein E2O39_10410 [Planctomycetota bacterium]|nr:MAG: hypothetical protein E2O39_10410 [Planctomycetota bacterium]